MLEDKEIDALESGHWAIDCFAMRIEPRGGGPSLFSDAGRIEQGGNGGLRFTLYATQDLGMPHLEAAGVLRPGLGEFVGVVGYVRLVARDTEHREWVGDAWIDKQPAVWFNPPAHTDHGSVWAGEVVVLRGPRETVRPRTDDLATCVSFIRLNIPARLSRARRLSLPASVAQSPPWIVLRSRCREPRAICTPNQPGRSSPFGESRRSTSAFHRRSRRGFSSSLPLRWSER